MRKHHNKLFYSKFRVKSVFILPGSLMFYPTTDKHLMWLKKEYSDAPAMHKLADFIIKEGRALLIVFNKYDLIPDKHEFDNNINNFITTNLPQINNSSIIKISSLGGYGIQKMMKQSIDIYREWTNRVPTSKLNGWFNPDNQTLI